jgi:hypothetical protein
MMGLGDGYRQGVRIRDKILRKGVNIVVGTPCIPKVYVSSGACEGRQNLNVERQLLYSINTMTRSRLCTTVVQVNRRVA